MQSQKCAALTMAWKSYPFLEKWVDYYGHQFGRDNLFVLAHGEDTRIKEICTDVNLWTLPREFTVEFDPIRWRALSEITSALTKFYQAVITCDCDELIVLDPSIGGSLKDYLLASNSGEVLQATGFNLLPFMDKKPVKSLDWQSPLSKQMNMLSGSLEYSKACVSYGDVDFHPGGHTLNSGTPKLTSDLLLFHLKYIDMDEWLKVAGELKSDIAQDIKRGGDKHRIGTHWRKGGRATASQGKDFAKGTWIDGDYIGHVYERVSQASYTSEWRRDFRKRPTRGALPVRFRGTF